MRSANDPLWDVIYPVNVRGAGSDDRWKSYLLPVLVPASWAYQSVSNALRSARCAGAVAGPVGVRVVSVGNLEVGGSGKTPLAMHLIDAIAAAGGRPVYISRGFGGLSERLDVVSVVTGPRAKPNGTVRGVRYLRGGAAKLASRIGDEGAMVSARLPDVPLVQCRDKTRALNVAADLFSPTHAVLDDAFQSWGVPRDVDIVLVNGARPFGDGWLIPAGRLREPPDVLERADFIGVNGIEYEGQLETVAKAVAAFGIRKPLFGVRRTIDFVPAGEGVPYEVREPFAALSAIGRPDPFERQLAARRRGFAAAFRYPDHHAYNFRDLEWIIDEADRRGIETLVTTEKDWVKLSELDPPHDRFAVARLTLELFGADPLPTIEKAAD
jgi:tetraacyldisaccharide 4'-kinase